MPPADLVASFPAGMLLRITKKGSANKNTLDDLLEKIVELYADRGGVADVDGLRIIVKLDGGPSVPLKDVEWMEKWAARVRS